MMLKAVLFDMDGTIFDTERMIYWGWEQLVSMGKLPPEVLDHFFEFCGRNRNESIGRYKRMLGADFPIEECYRLRDELINERLDREGMPLKPYVPQVFEDIKAQGLRLALVTGTRRVSVDAHLRRAGFAHYFEQLVCGESVPTSKPSPDGYLLAMRQMGLAPQECLAVEDSLNGVRAAYAADLRVVMIPDIFQPNEEVTPMTYRICNTLQELPPITQALLAQKTENQPIKEKL